MIVLIACLSILAFMLAFHVLGIVPVASQAIATARAAGQVMGDKTLDEEIKEREVQKASISLMKSFASLVVRLVLLLVAAFLPIYLAELVGVTTTDAVLGFLLRLDVILITSVILIAAVLVGRRLWQR